MKVMVKSAENKKIVSLSVENSLYDLLKEHASQQGEGVADLISRLLTDSMESWCAYCDSLRLLEMEDESSAPRVCVVDKA